MDLTKKTTILFPPSLHAHLVRVAEQQGISLGELVRTACTRLYGRGSIEDRLRAVEVLARLALPVGTPGEMKRESVPAPEDLLP